METLERLKPDSKARVYDLVREAGVNVADWANYKKGPHKAAANPKYCYNWSFVEAGKLIVLNLWFDDMFTEGDVLHQRIDFRNYAENLIGDNSRGPRRKRALELDHAVALAYFCRLPVRVIVCSGSRKVEGDPEQSRSSVRFRRLDEAAWAVSEYDQMTGFGRLVRGLDPASIAQTFDDELSAFEGEMRERMCRHRRRERKLRDAFLAKRLNRTGRLVCDVPDCGFDFFQKYGALGEGFAEVHHTQPLGSLPPEGAKLTDSDLAVVCANCHRMIHRGGQCRELASLKVL